MPDKTKTPIEQVINAWVDKGPAPAVHEKAKATLRRNWPTMYNALKTLVYAQGLYVGKPTSELKGENANKEPIARAKCTGCAHEWIVDEGQQLVCPEKCKGEPFIEVRMLRRVK